MATARLAEVVLKNLPGGVGQGGEGLDVVEGDVGKELAEEGVALPQHLSPNVSTSGRIFGRAEVGHTTMGTLSGL